MEDIWTLWKPHEFPSTWISALVLAMKVCFVARIARSALAYFSTQYLIHWRTKWPPSCVTGPASVAVSE